MGREGVVGQTIIRETEINPISAPRCITEGLGLGLGLGSGSGLGLGFVFVFVFVFGFRLGFCVYGKRGCG